LTIKVGNADIVIAGGMGDMSQALYLMKNAQWGMAALKDYAMNKNSGGKAKCSTQTYGV